MKNLIIVITVLFSLTLFAAQETKAYQIYTTKGKKITFDKLVKEVSSKKFIFFGEYHDNPIIHWLQFELTKRLYAIKKNKLILGAEMFESDNQYILNEYLQNQISTNNFQNEVRLWPNYNTDYKALIEFAKTNNISFIASNIPRRYANMVYKKGLESLNKLSNLAKSYITPLDSFEFDPEVDCYKNLIALTEHGGTNMAKAQAIKDATMAYFILKNSKENSTFLHFNGTYHSDNYQGILHYLLPHKAKSKVSSISTVYQESIDVLDTENSGIADFIIAVPETMTRTH